jgi:hypothetical protein
MHNAGTGEGILETLGWEGAEGSAPGLVADLWMEFHWLNLLVLFWQGALYGYVWRKAQLNGGPWVAQYVIMSALSVYLVMQTMEAVIFRLLILSIPLWLSWSLAKRSQTANEGAVQVSNLKHFSSRLDIERAQAIAISPTRKIL